MAIQACLVVAVGVVLSGQVLWNGAMRFNLSTVVAAKLAFTLEELRMPVVVVCLKNVFSHQNLTNAVHSGESQVGSFD